ncbi:MAG: plastocyanin/azurin family copper-binding protein [Thermoplasmatota archaeon]
MVGCLVVGGSAAGVATMGAMGYGPMAGWMMNERGGMMGGACPMCAGSSAGTNGTGIQVAMKNLQFAPTTLTVRVAQTVTWTNEDSVAHTVTSDSGTDLNSPLIQPGGTWEHTFSLAGTFRYHCTPHSSQSGNGPYTGMSGTIIAS